jgi:hypothetical protein
MHGTTMNGTTMHGTTMHGTTMHGTTMHGTIKINNRVVQLPSNTTSLFYKYTVV